MVANRNKLKYISSILYKNNKIRFFYSLDASGNFSVLDSCTVENSLGSKTKKVKFDHSYFGAGDNIRTRLDKFYCCTPNNTTSNEIYEFTYKNNVTLPKYFEKKPGSGNWTGSISCEDFWGYFNGYGNANSEVPYLGDLSPYVKQSRYSVYSTNKIPNSSYAKACIIESIKYPTRGKTVFEFEPNYSRSAPYSFSSDTIVGGLRLKKLYNYQLDGSLLNYKEYYYYEPVHRIINKYSYMNKLEKGYRAHITNCNGGVANDNCQHPFWEISEYPVLPITNGNGSIIYYGKVCEVFKDNQGITQGKNEFFYDCYKESNFSSEISDVELGTKSIYSYDHGSYSPLLYKQDTYKYENNSFGLVQRQLFSYISKPKPEFCTGLDCEFYGINLNSDDPKYFDDPIYEETKGFPDMELLSEKTVISFLNEKQIISFETYKYNSNGFLRQKSLLQNSNDTLKFVYKYPSDINTGVYSSMKTLNMLNYPVEVVSLKNNNVIGSNLTTYRANGSGYVPDKVYKLEFWAPFSYSGFTNFNGSTKDSHYSTTAEISYDLYNTGNGNLRQATTRDGITTAYLWDSSGRYPVAKVDNATYSTISSLNGYPAGYSSQSLYSSLKNLIPSVMINTYSYTPLIGMTSQTDPNGVTTYYEYDSFGRLKCTKDDDGNILKQYDYHYSN